MSVENYYDVFTYRLEMIWCWADKSIVYHF